MRPGLIICGIVLLSALLAGCIQLPGIHTVRNAPDPVIGQWTGGEPPASDRHLIFYENQTFFSVNYFLNRNEEIDRGNWTRIQPGRYVTQSASGEIIEWGYDPFDDTVYRSGLPQMNYHRYRG